MKAFEDAIERGEIDLKDFDAEHDVIYMAALAMLRRENDQLVPAFAMIVERYQCGLPVHAGTLGRAIRRLFSVPLEYTDDELGSRVLAAAVEWVEANER